VPHSIRGASSIVAPATAMATAVGVQSVFKDFYFFCLNSDGGKFYMKIVAFDEFYNFVVQGFSI
jgi:hypothetical protein